jgi:hypothetical protein
VQSTVGLVLCMNLLSVRYHYMCQMPKRFLYYLVPVPLKVVGSTGTMVLARREQMEFTPNRKWLAAIWIVRIGHALVEM